MSRSARLLRKTIGYLTTEDPEVNEERFEKLCEEDDMSSAFQVRENVTEASAKAHLRLEAVYENRTKKPLLSQVETEEDKEVAILLELTHEWQTKEADTRFRRLDEADRLYRRLEEAKAKASDHAGDDGDDDGESYCAKSGAELAAASDGSDVTIVPKWHSRSRSRRDRKARKAENSAVGE